MTTISSVNPDLLELLEFLKTLPDELQRKAIERIRPIADELDEEWWDLQFANTPPDVLDRMVAEVDADIAAGRVKSLDVVCSEGEE